jgi:hypothetical protein
MARVGGLLVLILALGAGWHFAWNWGAGELDRRATLLTQRLAEDGARLECNDRRIEGFPFRIGVYCTTIEFAPPGGGAFSAGELRSAAQFYNPGHVVAELDGPALVQLPNGMRFQAEWENLRSSLRAGLSGISAVSLELRQPVLSEGKGTRGEQVLARSDEIQVHARRSQEDPAALDTALSTQAMRDDKERFPAFSLASDIRLDALADALRQGFDLEAHVRESGISGEARNVVLEPSAGGRMVFSGPFKIGADGLIDAKFRIEANEIASLGTFFAALFPRSSDAIDNIAFLLSSIGPSSTGANADAGSPATGNSATITLTIQRGTVSLGLISLGTLPPLF